MQAAWLDAPTKQEFHLTEHGIELDNASESLAQQTQRSYITALPHYGCLAIEGTDASTFLQGQLSCDLQLLNEQQACRGVHCTPKGRAIASFQLLQQAEHRYLAVLPHSTLPLLQQSLAKYIVFSKAQLQDDSAHCALFGLSGPDGEALVAQHWGNVPGAAQQQGLRDGAFCIRQRGTVPRFLLGLPASEAGAFWQLASKTLQIADSAAWLLQDIQCGVGEITAPISETFIPQMLNYDSLGAISFAKGCYTGQEVIARAHYRGAVKRRMQGFQSENSACPGSGDPLFSNEGKNCGTVITAVTSKPGHVEGLAVLPADHAGQLHSDEQGNSPALLAHPIDYPD